MTAWATVPNMAFILYSVVVHLLLFTLPLYRYDFYPLLMKSVRVGICETYYLTMIVPMIVSNCHFYTVFLMYEMPYSSPQRNEVGNSTGMEYHGFQQCMQFLLGVGMSIGVLITDRHTSIAKHMRERLPNIKHYFDLWHIQKSRWTGN